jgi:hypothetical protein
MKVGRWPSFEPKASWSHYRLASLRRGGGGGWTLAGVRAMRADTRQLEWLKDTLSGNRTGPHGAQETSSLLQATQIAVFQERVWSASHPLHFHLSNWWALERWRSLKTKKVLSICVFVLILYFPRTSHFHVCFFKFHKFLVSCSRAPAVLM